MRPPPLVEAISIAKVSVKWGTSWKRNRSEPTSSVVARVMNSLEVERVLDQVVVAPGADDAAEELARARGAYSFGRAGMSVPGQRSTGTAAGAGHR